MDRENISAFVRHMHIALAFFLNLHLYLPQNKKTYLYLKPKYRTISRSHCLGFSVNLNFVVRTVRLNRKSKKGKLNSWTEQNRVLLGKKKVKIKIRN